MTTTANEFPCPVGTFSNVTHRMNVTDCQLCREGMYCDQLGLSEPTGLCNAGMPLRNALTNIVQF